MLNSWKLGTGRGLSGSILRTEKLSFWPRKTICIRKCPRKLRRCLRKSRGLRMLLWRYSNRDWLRRSCLIMTRRSRVLGQDLKMKERRNRSMRKRRRPNDRKSRDCWKVLMARHSLG